MKPGAALADDQKTLPSSAAALLPLLDAFNHRHKNQHRASHWWSAFGLLRRSVRALAARPRDIQAVRARARFLGQHVVPRAYMQVLSHPSLLPLNNNPPPCPPVMSVKSLAVI